MDKLIARSGGRRALGAKVDVADFASRIVARLVAREDSAVPALSEALLCRLAALIASPQHPGIQALQPELRRERVSAADLADHYIPELARRLGADWEEDCISFSDVTIGAARLQAILREIGAGWAADVQAHGAAQALLLVVPHFEQHTLGALVLAGRLRRKGISVCLQIGPTGAELGALLANRRFDGAMISTACTDRLDTCKALVRAIKAGCDGRLLVALGGAVLDRRADVAQITGADIVTNDVDAALAFFGITAAVERALEPA